MNRERLVPKLRFEEFENDEEWVTYELGDISDVTKLAGFEYTKYVIYSEIGSIIALRGLNIKNGKIILDDVKYIDQSDFSKLDRSKLYQGDIILTYVGTIGNLAVIPENDKYYLAPNVARIRLTAGINPEFVTQRMGSRGFYRKIINPLIATSSQPALSMLNIRKFTLKIPGYKEQVKIGSHLKKLDELIQLQQSKVNKIKDLKSAYLSEMFPKEGEKYPKKRFEGFTESWKEFSLEQVAKIRTGYPFNSNEFTKDGKYLVIANGNIQTSLPIVDSSAGNRITMKDPRIVDEYVLNDGDILVTMDGTVGRTAKVIEKNQILAQRVGRLTAYENSEFLYQALQTGSFYKNMSLVGHGGTIKHISLSEIESYKITMPDSKEQNKVAEFFKNLDNQISIEEEKLSKLEKLKQAYLNDMFI